MKCFEEKWKIEETLRGVPLFIFYRRLLNFSQVYWKRLSLETGVQSHTPKKI